MTGEQLALVALLAVATMVLGAMLFVWAVSCLWFPELRLGEPAGEPWFTFLLVVARMWYDVIADRVRVGRR